MPDLAHSLPSNDLAYLRIVAGLWGLELAASDAPEAAAELADLLCDAELAGEIIATLPAEARAALQALAAENGRLPWPVFARRFGEIREMGAGRRDRERPHLQPSSPAEALYYRGLLARAFFDTPDGPQEFAYLPDEFMLLIHDEPEEHEEIVAIGRPASPAEKAFPIPADDRILDDATTLLAAMRMSIAPPPMRTPRRVLLDLLVCSRLISGSAPRPEPVKAFLEMPRRKAVEQLSNAWRVSDIFNELQQVPGLICEGEWKNQPLVTREFLLSLLEAIPAGQWWSLAAFLRAIKEKYPDFQRPSGDYDSWFIKRESDSAYLRGFATWDEVDGALVRYLITGPLTWLGLAELAAPEAGAAPSAFRLVDPNLLKPVPEDGKIHVSSQGRITIPRLVPRVARYQIARFCEWDESRNDEEYSYHVTPASLERAAKQGLKVSHLLPLLAKNAKGNVPPAFIRALQRWELNGTEARVETQVGLRVTRPEVLEELRGSKAGRFLGELLGPTSVVIQRGAESKVMAALAELGLLASSSTDV
jgi:hypothetical protein